MEGYYVPEAAFELAEVVEEAEETASAIPARY